MYEQFALNLQCFKDLLFPKLILNTPNKPVCNNLFCKRPLEYPCNRCNKSLSRGTMMICGNNIQEILLGILLTSLKLFTKPDRNPPAPQDRRKGYFMYRYLAQKFP